MFKDYLEGFRSVITENNPKNGICFDGAVDCGNYFARNSRLMFLLKETNGNKNNGEKSTELTDWDYMSWVREQAACTSETPLYRQVFRNIAMWSRMFEIFTEEKRVPDMSELINEDGLIINETLCKSLYGIAIINLKKSWGTEYTDWSQMKKYLDGDICRKEILRQQLDVLKPSVVLCGGTFDFAKTLFAEPVRVEEVIVNEAKVSYFRKDGAIFVACYHPSRPGWSRKSSFNYIANILQAVGMVCKNL